MLNRAEVKALFCGRLSRLFETQPSTRGLEVEMLCLVIVPSFYILIGQQCTE